MTLNVYFTFYKSQLFILDTEWHYMHYDIIYKDIHLIFNIWQTFIFFPINLHNFSNLQCTPFQYILFQIIVSKLSKLHTLCKMCVFRNTYKCSCTWLNCIYMCLVKYSTYHIFQLTIYFESTWQYDDFYKGK